MVLSVISNFTANVAHRNLVINDRGATRDIAELSSGLRVLGARDDAASLAIGSRLKAEVGALRQANVNAGQANSLLQVADGALSTISEILFRLKTLSVQSGSDNVGAAERASLQLEFAALQEEIERIARDTEFTGVQLINGEENITIQAGDDSTPEAGPGLRVIDNTIGPKQGITDIQFSDSFDATLIEISYAVDGSNGVFTVTDLSQPVGAAGRTATGTTSLADRVTGGQTETIDVVFDRGGANERTVSITIDETFDKRAFNPTRLNPTGQLEGVGFGRGVTFDVGSYGGNLAGLGVISADSTTPITASTLQITNANGDKLVATTTVDFTATNTVQNVRLQNDQGDFVSIAMTSLAAVPLFGLGYRALQDPNDTAASLTLGSLNGQGNDLVTGSVAITEPAIARAGTIAHALNNGNIIAIREIGGSADSTALSLSFDAATNRFTGTIGGVTGPASNPLSSTNGGAGTTTVQVGGRRFEVTVAGDFDRTANIANTRTSITAAPNGFVGRIGNGDLSVQIIGLTMAAGQTLGNVLTGLANADFSILGGDLAAANRLGARFGDFSGAFRPGVVIPNRGAPVAGVPGPPGTQNVTLQDRNGNQIVIQVSNRSNEIIEVGLAAAFANPNDRLLDQGETITFRTTSLGNTVFLAGGGTAGASLDILEVSGDLVGMDNRARLEAGAAGRELTAAVISIAHSDTERGDLRAQIDLTIPGPQTVVLRNDAGDSVTLNINLQESTASIAARQASVNAVIAGGVLITATVAARTRAIIAAGSDIPLPAAFVAAAAATGTVIPDRETGFSEDQLNRRGTSSETFFLFGELRQSVIYSQSSGDQELLPFVGVLAEEGQSSSSERSFSFKVGSGVLEEDSVVFNIGAANLRALGLQTTGPEAVRIDGDDNTAADSASVSVSTAIDRLNNVRAIVGAGQNRLEFSANNVATAIENTEAARSTLLDLDVAAGITAFTSKQILVQTGISVLAQANQQPEQLLRLFQ